MKNKKIILGLGTITALGAMSMGFVACKKTTTDDTDLKNRLDLIEKHLNKDGALFKTEVDAFFEKTGTGNTAKDPKAVGELKKDATVKELIEAVKKIAKFSDKYDVHPNEGDTETTTLNGTTKKHTLIITKKDETLAKTKLKTTVEFSFTLAAK